MVKVQNPLFSYQTARAYIRALEKEESLVCHEVIGWLEQNRGLLVSDIGYLKRGIPYSDNPDHNKKEIEKMQAKVGVIDRLLRDYRSGVS